jgi:hypothetical protein
MTSEATFAFNSEREAAAKIRAVAHAAGTTLYALPYSRFDPDKTTWWLSPTSRNPAYAFGKIVVERPTIVADGAKLVGLHIEKGVGPGAAPIFDETPRGRRLVMHRDWIWHSFVRALLAGAVDDDLANAERAADGLGLVVEIVAGMQHPPRLEQDEDRPVDAASSERIRFSVDGGALNCAASSATDLLSAVGNRESLASIGGKLTAMKNADWIWLEVLIGVPLRPAADGLAANEVWQRVCAPWLAWLR